MIGSLAKSLAATYLIRRIDSGHTFADFRTEDTTVYEPVVDAAVDEELLVFSAPDNPPPATPGKTSDVTGQNLGLHFDPKGADFTLWINHFKNELYRNWIVPQEALSGAARGMWIFEFTVERDGTMSALRLLKTSGTASLDQAAQKALTASKFTKLPNDYSPPRVTMQVGFIYNEAPPE